MEEELPPLPERFDLIVVGTGFPESVLAAAAARIGKSVLHLESNEFYGASWASFNLEQYQHFIAAVHSKNSNSTDINFEIQENCGIVCAEQMWHLDESPPKDNKTIDVQHGKSDTAGPSKDVKKDALVNIENCPQQSDINVKEIQWTKESIEEEFRHFNIDLSPKLLYSCGDLVKLLTSSNICRYAEFRAVDHVCVKFNQTQIRMVPSTRSDVFNTKDLTVVEKRLLMKLLSQCQIYEKNSSELQQFQDKTFVEFLKANRLTDKIIYYISNAISMSNETTTFEIGMKNTMQFLQSLGRYSDTPFIFPLYGCGELPQCFCRLCAVFGGTYCLKKSITNYIFGEETNVKKVVGIKFGNRTISAENFVVGYGNVPKQFIKSFDKNIGIARVVLISSTPMGDHDINTHGGGVNFVRLSNGDDHALVLHLSHYAGCCPKGLYLIHIITKSVTGNPKTDLKPFVDQILELEYAPMIKYSSYFLIPKYEIELEIAENMFITNSQFYEVDYEKSLAEAKTIFEKFYPSELFLPRAPDPEEIVIGNEDPTQPRCDDVLGLLKAPEGESKS